MNEMTKKLWLITGVISAINIAMVFLPADRIIQYVDLIVFMSLIQAIVFTLACLVTGLEPEDTPTKAPTQSKAFVESVFLCSCGESYPNTASHQGCVKCGTIFTQKMRKHGQ